jgi:GLPGLI family protein
VRNEKSIKSQMKKLILFASVILLTVSGWSQVTEGHISYKIDLTSDNPDMQSALSMMQGSMLDIYFMGQSTRAEMKMGSMMNVTSITNERSGEVLMLMSGMIGFNAIKTTMKELEAQNQEAPKVEITLVGEKKDILGFECKKAILMDEQGNESTFWYTEEIVVSKKGQNYLNDKVPGFPLEYDINNSGFKMTMTASSAEKSLKKNERNELFNLTVPEGYKEMSLEDLKNMGMN